MIKQKKKICKTCETETYIFSKGECKSCAQKRYAVKAQDNRSKKKPTSIKRTPTKKQVQRKIDELEVMIKVWEENEDIDGRCGCSECGKSLTFDRTYCAHILSKGAFPQFRTNPDNIIILCLECHTNFDCDLKSEMKIWPFIEERIFELKKIS
ncbi:MAG: hypothetical protein AAFO07_34155 [Bacteroidota bacterium]